MKKTWRHYSADLSPVALGLKKNAVGILREKTGVFVIYPFLLNTKRFMEKEGR